MRCVSEGMCHANLKLETHDHLVRIHIGPRFSQRFVRFGGYTATFIGEGIGSGFTFTFTDVGGCVVAETSEFLSKPGLEYTK